MTAMTTQERDRCWYQAMRDWAWGAVLKTEGRAAVDAADDWVESNMTSFNSALPVGFRTKASTLQKAQLLAAVLWRKIGRYEAREDNP